MTDSCRFSALVPALAGMFLATAAAARSPDPPAAPDPLPLTLEKAILLAIDNQPQLESARQALRGARARAEVTAAGKRPSLQYALQTERKFENSRSRGTDDSGRPIVIPQSVYSTLDAQSTLTLRQLVYDFRRTASQVRASRDQAEVARQGLETVLAQVVLQVRLAYIAVLFAGRDVEIARETTGLREALLRTVERLFGGGLRPRFDVERSRVDLQNARLAEIAARATYDRSLYALDTALGIPDLPTPALEDFLDRSPPSPVTVELVQYALDHRPEVLAGRANVRSAEANLRAARVFYFPRLDTTGTYLHNDGTALRRDEWTVQVEASIPLYNGDLTHNTIVLQRAALDQARADLRNVENGVVQEVRDRVSQVEEARARVESARVLVDHARENLRLARQRYDSGIGRIIDVTDAQGNLTQALQALNRANSDLHVAVANLDRAVHLYPSDYPPLLPREERPETPALGED